MAETGDDDRLWRAYLADAWSGHGGPALARIGNRFWKGAGGDERLWWTRATSAARPYGTGYPTAFAGVDHAEL